ncbi:hypothetical protein [Nakamurella multipartita]|uniref:Uncharacterized protein n=1 Tax=Nakamurella multipartita (strain ATCC 700099 / DSM 44233 / CIP 104796 / JCM 9543 / NBRC 105858 / Y-104) TaxID=479431 RepID=C8XBJ9_NAKMY|nr:hypothetical protein [Nakamurella multipartita]ACV77461.1 hypothetical protein Namu_1053 [Nakamurella multipartita DSM 44233]
MVLAGLPGAITGLAGARSRTSIAPAPSAATAPGHRLAGITGPRIGAGLVRRRFTAPAGQTGQTSRTLGPATPERGPAGGFTGSAPAIGTIRRSLAPTPTTGAAPGASAGPMVLAGLPSAITGLAGARPRTSIAPAPSAAAASGDRFTATATGNRMPAPLIRRHLTRPLGGSAQTSGEITREITATSSTVGAGTPARTGQLRGDGSAISGTIGAGIPARAGQFRGDVLGGAGGAAELRRTMAAAHRSAAPLAVTGLPSALTGVVGAHAGPTTIAPAPSAATSGHHRLAGTTGSRMSAGLLRRRETAGAWPAAAPARRGPARGPVAAQVGADRRAVPAAAGHRSAPPVRRTVRTGASPAAASAPAASSRATFTPATFTPAAFTPAAFTPASAGPTATALAAYQVPHSLQSLIPTGSAAYRLPSIGSARTIDAARTAAAPGPGAVGPRTAATRSTVPAPGATTRLRRSPVSGAAPSTGAPLQATAASLRRRDAHPGHPARESVERTLGLLLRQAIPPATGITPAAETTIRRMPPSPPVGTPRLGTHRQNPPARGPEVPASADPSWSFAGSGRPDRSASDLRIGSRNRPGGSVTLAGPAVPPDTRPVADRRNSLLDLVPPSLFDRARAGLATASGLAGGAVEPSPVSPSGFAPTSSEVSRMSQPADETVPRRQPIAEALTAREWDELVDVIVDRLEDRVLDELARRGRRFTPGVF